MLELYQAEGCPYCEQVPETLTDLGVSYVNHNPRTAAGDRRNGRTHAELLSDDGLLPRIPAPTGRTRRRVAAG